MCYKNVAPPRRTQIQNTCGSTRISPRWGSNTKYMRGYKNIAPLGLKYEIQSVYKNDAPLGL